ncbi:C1 family peptidase [Methanobrevibacter millerae]|uniref:Adhesin-like protein with cysteine protease domain n=1 Tax=Methanobrevibacter millerae TaxID=230361 RepID=A0A0U3DPP1_9EURY|nr:C1 family peptidase [Methanobrevibacter millerae]ALT67882.1 adhesin-like protein with cysteine protease domain [Methanobrevibacter millerae]
MININKSIVFSLILLILLTVSAVSAEENITDFTTEGNLLKVDSSNDNFNDLNNEINGSLNELKLTHDYVYDEGNDINFTDGINVSKSNFLLDGNGYSIDGNGKARIFNIIGNNVTLKNLIIKNALNGAVSFVQPNAEYYLDNVTIQNSSSKYASGGIELNATNLVVNNSKFISNTGTKSSDIFFNEKCNVIVLNSTFEGGIESKWSHIYFSGGALIVDSSTFANSRSSYANAIYGEDGRVTVRNTKFRNLTVLNSAGAIGVKYAVNLTVEDCEFTNITSGKDGGVIFADIDQGYVTITNSKFHGCFAAFGSAVMQLRAELNIINSTFEDNIAMYDGGVLWTSYADVSIENSTFKRNNVVKEDLEIGGVLYFDKGDILIKGSTFIDNHGSNKGDAVFTYDSKLTLQNNTFKDNGNALYSVFSTQDIAEDNKFNNDLVSVNNTFYATIVVNDGIELTLINNTPYKFDTLPDKFNLKDYGLVGPVRDQGNMGACWTFATSGALESALLKATGKLYNFSQDNIQNTMLQYSIYGVDGILEGAQQSTGVGYLVNWYGPYPTDLDRYDELGKVSTHINMANESIHVQDVVFFPARQNATDNYIFKKALMDYGAFLVAIYAGENSKYYNETSAARYYNGTKGINHAVTLVGWDDNYPASNFLNPPSGDGAWIIKNSWGTEWGDEGYFYLSYYDTSFNTQNPQQYPYYAAYLFNNTVPYNKNYQADAGQLNNFVDQYKYFSNTYTALEDDLIAAVGTYFDSEGVDYEFDIYVNGVLKHTQNGVSPFAGYHTIKLTQYIPISANDTFKVVFKNSSLPFESNSRHHHKENVSFGSVDGVNWEDLAKDNVTAILKVYTIPMESVIIQAEDIVMYYKNGTRFEVKLFDSQGNPFANENITLSINGVSYNRTTDENGSASIAINLNPGNYTCSVSYIGRENYTNSTVENTITVLSTIRGNDLVKIFRNESQYYATFLDGQGNPLAEGTNVTFNINGVFYTRQVNGSEGKAKLNINLEAGKYVITAYHPFNNQTHSNNITVLSRVIDNDDLVKYYRNGSQYVVTILGADGKVVGAGENVTFNINGVMYTRQTNESGQAKLNINLGPGNYTITAMYNDCRVSNNIEVLPVLFAEDLVKKYGISDQFKALLVDGQGNPFPNQNITFNINGVFYQRTTNDEGYAALNIRLGSPNDSYIITSSFNGTNISNKITIVD